MGILDDYENRVQSLSDDMSLLSEGEINAAQMGLRSLGETGGLLGDAVGYPVGAVLEQAPEFVKKGISQVVNGVMSTGYAKAALKWMEENPEHARDITSAFNAMDLVGAGIAPSVAKKGITSAAHNMPNELNNFYGSGVGGQLLDVTKAVPSTVGHMAKQAFTPSGQARAGEGISSRLHSVAKDKVRRMDTGDPTDKATKQAPGFLEGQMDQSSLLATGAEGGDDALRDIFGNVQDLHRGDMNKEGFQKMFSEYKPENYEGMSLDDELLSTMEQRVRNAQGIKPGENVKMVVRHPTALTDVVPESTGGSLASSPAKRMFVARQLVQKMDPDKTRFDSVDDAKEFMAVRALVDESLIKQDGNPLDRVDKAIVKAAGPIEGRYKQREAGNANVRKYYEYKEKIRDGKKLTKPQQAKYDKLHDRVMKQKDNVVVDSKGRLYNQSSHRSAAKGLGGVNDQFVMDLDGNVLHFINDENDLFGYKVPGDKRVVSVTPPTRYNVFSDRVNAKDKAGTAARKAHSEMLESKYGAPKGKGGLTGQMGRAIAGFNPAGGHSAAAKNIGEAGVLASFLAPDGEEE